MAGATRGRSGSPPRKLAWHNAKAGNSSWLAVEPCSPLGARPLPPLPQRRAEPMGWLRRAPCQPFPAHQAVTDAVAERVVAAREEGTADRILTAKEEDALANALRKSAKAYSLDVDV